MAVVARFSRNYDVVQGGMIEFLGESEVYGRVGATALRCLE